MNRDDIAQENEIGPTSNRNFGTRQNQNFAPEIKRPYQWVYDVAFQHELLRGLGVSVSYNRRNFNNLIWTQNLAAPFSSYTLTSVANPLVAGDTIPIYNLQPAALGLITCSTTTRRPTVSTTMASMSPSTCGGAMPP